MRTGKTVFLLGAGAHCSYKFPSGENLKSLVADRLRSPGPQQVNVSKLVRLGLTNGVQVGQGVCLELARAILNSGQLSIDAYLNHNRHLDGYGVVGKAAIAQVLLDKENSVGAGGASDDDWLAYLFSEMLRGVGGAGLDAANDFVEKNQVAFVTFNYDRFLERCLHSRIKHSFGLDDDAALSTLRRIEICHVFGTLGDFPPAVTNNDPWIEGCKRIKLIHEAEASHEEVGLAQRLLREAHVICILGFGYHDENVALLQLKDVVRGCKGYVASTRSGLTDTEWFRRTRGFPSGKIRVGMENWQCRAALRNLEVF